MQAPAADGGDHLVGDVLARRVATRPRVAAVRHQVGEHAARVVAHLDAVAVRVQQLAATATHVARAPRSTDSSNKYEYGRKYIS